MSKFLRPIVGNSLKEKGHPIIPMDSRGATTFLSIFMKSHTFLSEYSLSCYIFMSEWSRLLHQLHLCFYERNPPKRSGLLPVESPSIAQ